MSTNTIRLFIVSWAWWADHFDYSATEAAILAPTPERALELALERGDWSCEESWMSPLKDMLVVKEVPLREGTVLYVYDKP